MFLFSFRSDGDPVSTPLLRFVQEHGNATVYQWRTGKEPASVEEVHLSFLEEDKEVEENEVGYKDCVLFKYDILFMGKYVCRSNSY